MADLYQKVFWHELWDDEPWPVGGFVKSQEEQDQNIREHFSGEDARGNPVQFNPERTCCTGTDGCERCQQYRCAGCGAWRPWWFGAADNQADVCDACWKPES